MAHTIGKYSGTVGTVWLLCFEYEGSCCFQTTGRYIPDDRGLATRPLRACRRRASHYTQE